MGDARLIIVQPGFFLLFVCWAMESGHRRRYESMDVFIAGRKQKATHGLPSLSAAQYTCSIVNCSKSFMLSVLDIAMRMCLNLIYRC